LRRAGIGGNHECTVEKGAEATPGADGERKILSHHELFISITSQNRVNFFQEERAAIDRILVTEML